jgi:ATP-dependent RNA/DNA helicase IGHMBP2
MTESSTQQTARAALSQLAHLWEQEQCAVREAYRQQRDEISLPERVRRGLALNGLVLEKTDRALAGRNTVWLRWPPETPPESFRISVGAPVTLWREGDGRAQVGLLSYLGPARIGVSTDAIDLAFLEAAPLNLDQEALETTFERGRDAIRSFQTSEEQATLRSILFGGELPAFVARSDVEFRDKGLNEGQQQAVRLALSAESVALIHGPPGTGKTRVLVELIRQIVLSGQNVLVTAATHAAVDNITERLMQCRMKPLRLGHPERVAPAVAERSVETLLETDPTFLEAEKLQRQADRFSARATQGKGDARDRRELSNKAAKLAAEARRDKRAARARLLGRSRIICSTAAGADALLLGENRYDWVVVDEATQAPDPICLAAVMRARKVVMAGDPAQMPPTLVDREAAKAGLGSTLFERCAKAWGECGSQLLTEQYRMHRDIMQFPSESMYGGQLRAASSVANHSLSDLASVDGDADRARAWYFLDTCRTGWQETRPERDSSLSNPRQAELTVAEVQRVIRRGLPQDELAVITPYSAQARLLREQLRGAKLADVEVGTVDSFQGQEREAVIVDLVRSNSEHVIGFLEDTRRMNVALTRARRHLVVIGNSETLSGNAYYRRLATAARNAGVLLAPAAH